MARPIVEELSIRFSAQSNSHRGKLIRYIKEHPAGYKELCIRVLEDCLQVLALDRYGGVGSEDLELLALQCACHLEGYAQVLRERFHLRSSSRATGVQAIDIAAENENSSKGVAESNQRDEESNKLDIRVERRRSMFG